MGAQDIARFAQLCCTHPKTLSRLTSLTLEGDLDEPITELPFDMLAYSPLRRFELLFPFTGARLGESFWTRMVNSLGARLRTVAVHLPPISVDAVQEVCRGCVQLEELFVVVEVREDQVITDALHDPAADPRTRLPRHIVRLFNDLADGLSLAPHLRRVHLKLRCWSVMHPTWLVGGPDCSKAILDVVRRCSARLMQIGLNSKAWRVRSSHLAKMHKN
jgi:hypothetical protein